MKLQRHFFFGIAILVGLAALATVSSAQTQPQPISVKTLTGDVYFVQGGAGSNTGFIVGKTGVIVVDAKMTADSAKDMLAAIAKVTPKPVTTVIITHSDADHVNGLAGFPTGLTIIAQDNCKKEMEESLNAPRMAAPKDYLPTKTVDKKETTTIDGVRLELFHWAPAQTSGDLLLYLPEQKIVFTGDIVATQTPYPIIHLEKNGSSERWVETMKGILALDAVTFVPGHGDLQTKDDLEKRLAGTEAQRAKIQQLAAQGKSLDEIKQDLGETSTGNNQRFPTFTEVVYKESAKN
jgi:cyclase